MQPWLPSSNLCDWGWCSRSSFYVSALVLTKAFKCGTLLKPHRKNTGQNLSGVTYLILYWREFKVCTWCACLCMSDWSVSFCFSASWSIFSHMVRCYLAQPLLNPTPPFAYTNPSVQGHLTRCCVCQTDTCTRWFLSDIWTPGVCLGQYSDAETEEEVKIRARFLSVPEHLPSFIPQPVRWC